MLRAVRGAVDVPSDQAYLIEDAVSRLIHTMLEQNGIAVEAIVTVFFTVTPDLKSLNPAMGIRKSRHDWAQVPMICAQEPDIPGMLPRCIRVLIQWHADENQSVQPVYLGGAKSLRPDL